MNLISKIHLFNPSFVFIIVVSLFMFVFAIHADMESNENLNNHQIDLQTSDNAASAAAVPETTTNNQFKNQAATDEINYDPEVENDYETGISKMNNTQGEKDYRAAYYYLNKAAAKGHLKAREEIAIAMIFGDHLQQNITGAKEIFNEISTKNGSARSQFYLGFLYAAGLGVKSNQAKAITYLTFSALGSNNLAQMSLGYRYWSSINVESNCEMSLNLYKKVATSVANRISSNSVGTVIHRIRLYDEEEKIVN
jgi:TPR repeat protein